MLLAPPLDILVLGLFSCKILVSFGSAAVNIWVDCESHTMLTDNFRSGTAPRNTDQSYRTKPCENREASRSFSKMAAPPECGVGGEIFGGDATNGAAAGDPLCQVTSNTYTLYVSYFICPSVACRHKLTQGSTKGPTNVSPCPSAQ